MGIGNLFKNLFSRSKKHSNSSEEKNNLPSLLSQIQATVGILEQKTSFLKEDHAEEKEALLSVIAECKSFKESEEISAAKFEQDILGKITAVSSSLDAVLAGNENSSLMSNIKLLSHMSGQRKALEK